MLKNHFHQPRTALPSGAFRTETAVFSQRWFNALAAAFALAATCPLAAAQQLAAIYPRHATANIETLFTVEGTALPTADSAQAGLKLSTVPAGSCQNARRYKAATAERYYFACTFDPSSTPVLIRIHNKVGGKSDFLGSFTIPVMDGPPLLSHLTISGNVVSGNARVRCEIGAACVTLAGDLASSDTITVEAKGANLPPDLYFEVDGCLQVGASRPDQRNEMREAVCTVAPNAGPRRIRILSAAPARGGNELWKTDLNAATP